MIKPGEQSRVRAGQGLEFQLGVILQGRKEPEVTPVLPSGGKDDGGTDRDARDGEWRSCLGKNTCLVQNSLPLTCRVIL